MPAADTREALFEVAAKESAKLAKLLDQVDEDLALARDDDDTSVKDTVAHRAR